MAEQKQEMFTYPKVPGMIMGETRRFSPKFKIQKFKFKTRRAGFAASQWKIPVLTVVSGAFSGAGRRISRRLKSFGLWARALEIRAVCACLS